MTVAGLAALFLTLAALAAVPSVSVLTVVSRAATGGLTHGALAALGVVIGDVIYILIALFGLAALVELVGPWMEVLRWGAAVLLVWFAWLLWRAPPLAGIEAGRSGRGASVMAGLAVTLADHKAIVFYLVLFPAFVEAEALTAAQVLAVLMVAVVAVFGAKMVWAFAARQAVRRIGAGGTRWISRGAALVLAGVAVAVLAQALTR